MQPTNRKAHLLYIAAAQQPTMEKTKVTPPAVAMNIAVLPITSGILTTCNTWA